MMAIRAGQAVDDTQFSQDTRARLERYVDLLVKWNRTINLVAPSSLDDVWHRHVADSAQVFHVAAAGCKLWVDMGSGAGFPGVVVACMAVERAPGLKVVLVESDHRKAEFLRVVSRETGIPVTVHASRIEALPPFGADIVSARALAPLNVLCGYACTHLAPSGRAVFLKGAKANEEVLRARKDWSFDLQTIVSVTDKDGSILLVSGLHRV